MLQRSAPLRLETRSPGCLAAALQAAVGCAAGSPAAEGVPRELCSVMLDHRWWVRARAGGLPLARQGVWSWIPR